MILTVGGLALPASEQSKAEYIQPTTSKRAIDGTLITKHLYDKWRLTYAVPDASSLELDYQAELYGILIASQVNAVSVTFISPYDQLEHTITARCTELVTPDVSVLLAWQPIGYSGVSFVMEEV